jgi:hypothetical protein
VRTQSKHLVLKGQEEGKNPSLHPDCRILFVWVIMSKTVDKKYFFPKKWYKTNKRLGQGENGRLWTKIEKRWEKIVK